jgi:hypothetical protein
MTLILQLPLEYKQPEEDEEEDEEDTIPSLDGQELPIAK